MFPLEAAKPSYMKESRRDRMIKNIVFDMGNVLVDYIADGVCRHFI